MFLVAAFLLTGLPVVAGEYCDDMETDLWTFGHTNSAYDGTWIARYDTDRAHSPVRSIRTSAHGGGYVGLDADGPFASRTFNICGSTVDSVMVWFNSYGVTAGYGPYGLDAYSAMKVSIYDDAENRLATQVYCILAFDDNSEHANTENMPGWIYQECRPDEYESGAPDYCRLADGSIQPPVGWWYRLKVSPAADLVLDWSQAKYMTVELIAFGAFLAEDHVGMYWDDFCYKLTLCGGPSVTIYDDVTSMCGPCGGNPPVHKNQDDCNEVILARNATLAGAWFDPGEGRGNVWLHGGGSVAATSTVPCQQIAIQFHCSDYNDGVTDIYVDDMNSPIARIDTYERCDWYVEITDLCPLQHTVKVVASTNSNMVGVVPSPHRATPALGHNDVWYICFGAAGGPSGTRPSTWGAIKSMYR
jgi:hypothetical protein